MVIGARTKLAGVWCWTSSGRLGSTRSGSCSHSAAPGGRHPSHCPHGSKLQEADYQRQSMQNRQCTTPPCRRSAASTAHVRHAARELTCLGTCPHPRSCLPPAKVPGIGVRRVRCSWLQQPHPPPWHPSSQRIAPTSRDSVDSTASKNQDVSDQ